MAISRSRKTCLSKTARKLFKKSKTPAQRRTVLGRASRKCSRVKKMRMTRKTRKPRRSPSMTPEVVPSIMTPEVVPSIMSPEMMDFIDVLKGGIKASLNGRSNEEIPQYLRLKIPDEYTGEGSVWAGVRDIVSEAGDRDASRLVADYLLVNAMALVKDKPLTPERLKAAIKSSPEFNRLWYPFELE